MKISEFDYSLPQELIAQTPLTQRTDSRLMILDRKTNVIRDCFFEALLDYLETGDVLVLNNTRVIPARLFGKVANFNKSVEIFLLQQFGVQDDGVIWECLVKPGKKLLPGTKVVFSADFWGEVQEVNSEGIRLIYFNQKDLYPFLEEYGEMPLPPYIKAKLEEKERYQTVFSQKLGSVAAPTAGLHFTDDFLDKIQKKGVKIAYITLNVGLGTFLPVKTDDIRKHKMHTEKYELNVETAKLVNQTKQQGKKVIAVGTTSVRVLEACADASGILSANSGETDIFIYPPYQFKIINGLLTNFHLPKSTLLMLISAFAGQDFIFQAYRQAVEKRYRFFSFGDAMLIL